MSDLQESSSSMEKWAQSYTLQVFARIAMVLFGGIGMPAIILIGISITDALSSLRNGIHELQISIATTRGEVVNLKTLHEYQLRSFDDRLSAQSRRLDSLDGRFDRLEKPFFDNRRSGPTNP